MSSGCGGRSEVRSGGGWSWGEWGRGWLLFLFLGWFGVGWSISVSSSLTLAVTGWRAPRCARGCRYDSLHGDSYAICDRFGVRGADRWTYVPVMLTPCDDLGTKSGAPAAVRRMEVKMTFDSS